MMTTSTIVLVDLRLYQILEIDKPIKVCSWTYDEGGMSLGESTIVTCSWNLNEWTTTAQARHRHRRCRGRGVACIAVGVAPMFTAHSHNTTYMHYTGNALELAHTQTLHSAVINDVKPPVLQINFMGSFVNFCLSHCIKWLTELDDITPINFWQSATGSFDK